MSELSDNLNLILKEKSEKILPENIKEGVTIFNVTGICSGSNELDTSDATATANDILLDKTAYVAGEKITGTIADIGSIDHIPSTQDYVIPAGYTSGGTIQGDENLIAKNIKSGVTIFNVQGKYSSKQGILGYTILEYIESTGTQYIDTGYTPNHDTTMELSISNITYLDSPIVCASTVWTLNRFILLADHNYRWYYNGEIIVGDVEQNTDKIDNIFIYRRYFKLNDTILYSNQATNTNFVADTTLRIFGGACGGSAGKFTKFRLHSFKLSESGLSSTPNYKFDMVPVREDSTGKLGLYNRVTDTFYPNLGEGEFLAGPVNENVLTITPSIERQEFVSDYDKIVVEPTSDSNTLKVNSAASLFAYNGRLDIMNELLEMCENITDMQDMFMYYKGTSLDLSHMFDTSKVTNMRRMFNSCDNLISLDLSMFDTSSVTTLEYMFAGSPNLTTINLSSFNIPNVTLMTNMFNGCDLLDDTTLNYILYMCATATSMPSDKRKLSTLSLSSTLRSRCSKLSNYNIFKAAGWTTD